MTEMTKMCGSELRSRTQLLNNIFRLENATPSMDQSSDTCEDIAELFCSFVESIGQRGQSGDLGLGTSNTAVDGVDDQELEELKRVCTTLTRNEGRVKRGASWVERWFGEYACALVAEVVSGLSLALKLVFLDDWNHILRCQAGGRYSHSAEPDRFPTLSCGQIKVSELDDFMAELDRDIRGIAAARGARVKLGPRSIEAKHHKAPQFIAKLITVHMEKRQLSSEFVGSRGGTAGVGAHTGSSPRGTCWSPVQGALLNHLPADRVLFEKAVLLFKLHLAQEMVS